MASRKPETHSTDLVNALEGHYDKKEGILKDENCRVRRYAVVAGKIARDRKRSDARVRRASQKRGPREMQRGCTASKKRERDKRSAGAQQQGQRAERLTGVCLEAKVVEGTRWRSETSLDSEDKQAAMP